MSFIVPGTPSVGKTGEISDLADTYVDLSLIARRDESYMTDAGIFGDSSTDNGANVNTYLSGLVTANGGCSVVASRGNVVSSTTFVVPTMTNMRGTGWFYYGTTFSLKNGAAVDAMQLLRSPDGVISNAFFCHLQDFYIYANGPSAALGTWKSGLTCVTNPQSTNASDDPNFDPQHRIERIWVDSASGEGIYQYGRSEVTWENIWCYFNQGTGFIGTFDTEVIGMKLQNNGLGGMYLPFAADFHATACHSYNNGTTLQWTTGQNWYASQHAVYNGCVYIAANTLTAYTGNPSTDTTNWSAPARPGFGTGRGTQNACPEWGYGYYIAGAGDISITASNAEQNAAGGIYILDVAGGVYAQINVDQINCNPATGTNLSTNPNNYAAITLDGTTACIADITVQNIGPAGYCIRLLNSSAGNEIHLTTDGSQLAIFSPDTTAAAIAANTIWVNGVLQVSVNTLASSGGATTIPAPSAYPANDITLTANCNITFPTPTLGSAFTLALHQDATGSRTVTWPTSVLWPANTAPTLSTTAYYVDLLEFRCTDGAHWFGYVRGAAYHDAPPTLFFVGSPTVLAFSAGNAITRTPAATTSILYLVVQEAGTIGVSSVTDTQGNTWVKDGASTAFSSYGLEIWHTKANTTSALTVTIAGPTSGSAGMMVYEVAGANATTPTQGIGSFATGSGTITTTYTPSGSCLVLSAGLAGSAISGSAGGWTETPGPSSGGVVYGAGATSSGTNGTPASFVWTGAGGGTGLGVVLGITA